MISNIQVTGISYEADDKTCKYVTSKIGRLAKYLPRHAQKTVSAEIKLETLNHKHGDKFKAEVVMNVPGKVITASDEATTMISAIDSVEAKLRTQLRDYKQLSIAHISKRGIMSRFKRSFKREL